jgi:DNA repair protein RadC
MSPYISNLDHEEIWALFLNRRNQVIRRFKVSSGGMTSTVFDVKILMKAAILEGTEAMVICHNHPSGNLNPSASDDNMTKRCKEACLAMDIRLLDHVILSVEGHYSYLDNGRL